MLNFLWDNKTWLFQGAGVAVVVGLVTFLYRLVRKSQNQITVVHIVESNKLFAAGQHASESAIQLTKLTRVSPLSYQEILEAIKDAPPLQVEVVGDRFKGTTVQWKAQVFNITKGTNEKVRLTLHFGREKPGLVFCEVPLSQYQELNYLNQDTPVTIQGIIERVERENGCNVTLRDAELFFTSV